MLNIVKMCFQKLDKFKQVLSKCSKFEIKGVLHSEMLLFCSLIEDFGCDCIIESGRGRGQSTEVLARWINSSKIFISIDKKNINDEDEQVSIKKLQDVDVITLNTDSKKSIPTLVEKYSNCRIAILIDGPKGKMAYRMAKNLFSKYKNIVMIAIHDMHYDVNIEIRKKAKREFSYMYLSDTDEFVKNFRFLDNPCWKVNRDLHNKNTGKRVDGRSGWIFPYIQGIEKRKSYGPTLMCLMRLL